MIIIISILGVVLYFLIGIFSGVIYIYVNKCKKMTLFYNGHQVSYYIAKKSPPFFVLGAGKFQKIIVSEYASKYFNEKSFASLLFHEQGHVINQYTFTKSIYNAIIFSVFYFISAIFTSWFTPIFIFIIYKLALMARSFLIGDLQHKNEYSADIYSAKIMKSNGDLDFFIKALMELSYLRESESHPNINKRLKNIYEAIKNK